MIFSYTPFAFPIFKFNVVRIITVHTCDFTIVIFGPSSAFGFNFITLTNTGTRTTVVSVTIFTSFQRTYQMFFYTKFALTIFKFNIESASHIYRSHLSFVMFSPSNTFCFHLIPLTNGRRSRTTCNTNVAIFVKTTNQMFFHITFLLTIFKTNVKCTVAVYCSDFAFVVFSPATAFGFDFISFTYTGLGITIAIFVVTATK